VIGAIGVTSQVARARDLFDVSATSTSGPPASAQASGSSLVDLIENLVDSQEEFAALQDQGFAASLDYAGVADAVQVTRNAAGTEATVTIPSTGLQKTFTGADEDDLEQQIEDYIKKDGASEWGRFLREINQRTYVGVADGNPQATTALAAFGTYRRFGLGSTPLVGGNTISLGSGAELRFDIDGGVNSTDSGDGFFAAGTLSTRFRFGERVALSVATPLAYRQVEEASIFHGGLELGLPITLLTGEGVPVRWTITPAGVVYVGGSYDLAAGGVVAGGSITSSLSFLFDGPGIVVTVANQYGTYQGVPIDIQEFKFDTDVDQQILKNGVMVTKRFGAGFVDAGVTYTSFLEDAAIDGYWSPTIGAGLNFGDASGVRIAYSGDLADGYTTHGGSLQLWFNR
jgi:hypothetical protein